MEGMRDEGWRDGKWKSGNALYLEATGTSKKGRKLFGITERCYSNTLCLL